MGDTWRGLRRATGNIGRRPSNVAGIAAGLAVGGLTYFVGREAADYLANSFLSTTAEYLDWFRNSVEFIRAYAPPVAGVSLGAYTGLRTREATRRGLRRTRP